VAANGATAVTTTAIIAIIIGAKTTTTITIHDPWEKYVRFSASRKAGIQQNSAELRERTF
jgi:hypothetical protein